MERQAIIFLTPFLVSASISLVVGVYSLCRRNVKGATPLALGACAQAFWTLGYVLELASPNLSSKIFWDNIQFLGMFIAPIAMLALALEYTGNKLAHPRLTWRVITLVVALSMVLVFTDDFHGLVRSDSRLVRGEPFSALVYEYTPIFFWMIIFVYGMVIWSAAILVSKLLRPGSLYRGQIATILVGISIPLLGGVLTLTGSAPGFHRDLTPYTFALNNLIIAWGLFYYRLFDIVPVAREAVIDSIQDRVIVVDEQNRVVDINPAALQFIEYPASQVIGKPAAEVFSQWPGLVDQFLDLNQTHTEIAVDQEDGTGYFDVRLSTLLDSRERLTGRVIVVRDITERKRAESEIEVRTRQLEQVNERLQVANEELHVLSRSKDEFVANVSHELRTPITNLKLYLDLAAIRPDKFEGYLQALNREVRRLEEMIDGLLTLSLIQQGRIKGEFEPLNLNSICRNYVDDRSPIATSKGLQIEFEAEAGLPMVYGEPSHIGQVLSILLTNALNYTPEGGRVALKTVARQGHGKTWAGFCVSDTGPGVSAEEQKHLFERFYRGKAGRNSNVPGTGLGLSIVKEIVERHHGLVEVESDGYPGRGAQFRVWLPCTEG